MKGELSTFYPIMPRVAPGISQTFSKWLLNAWENLPQLIGSTTHIPMPEDADPTAPGARPAAQSGERVWHRECPPLLDQLLWPPVTLRKLQFIGLPFCSFDPSRLYTVAVLQCPLFLDIPCLCTNPHRMTNPQNACAGFTVLSQ